MDQPRLPRDAVPSEAPRGLDARVTIVGEDGAVTFYPFWIREDEGTEHDRGWTDATPLKESPDTL